MRILIRVMSPILDLSLYITLPLMILTCPTIQYYVNITSTLVIWETNWLIPPMDTEIMHRLRCKREGYKPQKLRVYPNQNIIILHYILRLRWIHLLIGSGNYVIQPGAIEQILVMTTKLTTLSYSYNICRIKNPPIIFFTINHFRRLITWVPSRLAWAIDFWGRHQYLNIIIPSTLFTGTEK